MWDPNSDKHQLIFGLLRHRVHLPGAGWWDHSVTASDEFDQANLAVFAFFRPLAEIGSEWPIWCGMKEIG